MKVCKYCGNYLGPRQPTYCGKKCYYSDKFGNRDCVICGASFLAKKLLQKCCSDDCAKVKADETKREQVGQIGDVVKVCARCNKEYRQRLYKTQQIYCEDCIAFKDRDKCRRRRAKIKGVESTERINDYDIYERDNWTCKLCNQTIDKAAAWPEAASASIDHIVPLSKGGTHTIENVQSSHLGCNMVKGNREWDLEGQRQSRQSKRN